MGDLLGKKGRKTHEILLEAGFRLIGVIVREQSASRAARESFLLTV
jgi:hypothetical protein